MSVKKKMSSGLLEGSEQEEISYPVFLPGKWWVDWSSVRTDCTSLGLPSLDLCGRAEPQPVQVEDP